MAAHCRAITHLYVGRPRPPLYEPACATYDSLRHARRWSREGFNVALVARNAEKLEAATKSISDSFAFPCDVTDSAALTACIAAVESRLGPVDALLYNAGNGVFRPYDAVTAEDMENSLKINVTGLLVACQVCCPKMEARGGGFVCVTGATASLRGMPFTSVFAAAKAAQRSLAQSIARQLWKKNVHVCYGIIDAAVGAGPGKMSPDSIANEYWHLATQPQDCWTFQTHVQCGATSDMALL